MINNHDDRNDELIKCEICEKVFKTKILLENHFETDNAEYVNCNNFAKTIENETDNEKERPEDFDLHLDEEEKYGSEHKCETCGKLFSSIQMLKKHIYTVHEGQKDHKCDSCDKTFKTLHILEKHLHTIHDGYKDYKCESCGKSFSQLVHLQTHIMITHDGSKGQKCDVCSKSFFTKTLLKQHIKKVHNKKIK